MPKMWRVSTIPFVMLARTARDATVSDGTSSRQDRRASLLCPRGPLAFFAFASRLDVDRLGEFREFLVGFFFFLKCLFEQRGSFRIAE